MPIILCAMHSTRAGAASTLHRHPPSEASSVVQGDKARIGAYLLGKMPQRERDEFEARMLEEPRLLAAVRSAETAILAGAFAQGPAERALGLVFAAGAAIGAALTWLAQRVL